MRPSLRQEVEAFLRLHGPSTGIEVGLGVRARRGDVDRILASDAFEIVPTPDGKSPRATYFNLSERVPARRKANTKRSRLLLSVLRDGRRHSRDEIFERVGRFFLTNNAAAELRAQGVDVRYVRKDGVDFYWIESAESGSLDEAASSNPHSGASAHEHPGASTTPGDGDAASSSEPTRLFEPRGRGAYGDEAA